MKVLLVEDHPIVVEGYKNILTSMANQELLIEIAYNCQEAFKKLFSNSKKKFEIVILDINLPVDKKNNLFSGEDLGIQIKKKLPEIKLIILTSNYDKYRLFSIFKKVNPEGFLLKQDINTSEFILAFSKINSDACYYSQTINEVLRTHFNSNIILDKWDRMILYYISIGSRTRDLPDKIPLSLSSIEKRKKIIKDQFQITDNSDLRLLYKAKKLGYI